MSAIVALCVEKDEERKLLARDGIKRIKLTESERKVEGEDDVLKLFLLVMVCRGERIRLRSSSRWLRPSGVPLAQRHSSRGEDGVRAL